MSRVFRPANDLAMIVNGGREAIVTAYGGQRCHAAKLPLEADAGMSIMRRRQKDSAAPGSDSS